MTSSSSLASSSSDVAARGSYDSALFDKFRFAVRERFTRSAENQPVFFTAAPEKDTLFDIYLRHLPDDQRQTCTCNTCRGFVNRFGGLVTIDPVSGQTRSALWDIADAPDFYGPAVHAMLQHISKAKVTGVCCAEKYELGEQVTGPWTHFSIRMPVIWVNQSVTKTHGQVMAAKREDFRTMRRAVSEFKLKTVQTAVTLLSHDSFNRAEKVRGPAEFLLGCMEAMSKTGNRTAQDNILWRAIAPAPDGFCHPRSSMIGTLLEDLESGLPGEAAVKKFNTKMHPTAYMRPTAAPTEGAVQRAEKLAEQLGIAPSLRRRFARLSDVLETVWVPKSVEAPAKAGGVFAGLAKDSKPVAADTSTPAKKITFAKFRDTVLPEAQEMTVSLRHATHSPFVALVTAEIPEAPPIFQWDSVERRNPVSWYTYTRASQLTPAKWGMSATAPAKVTALTYKPHMWNNGAEKFKNHGQGVIFLLEGCADTQSGGCGLFPECMRSELHEVRSVIEAYSNKNQLGGRAEASACGVFLGASAESMPIHVTVRIGSVLANYIIDRWD